MDVARRLELSPERVRQLALNGDGPYRSRLECGHDAWTPELPVGVGPRVYCGAGACREEKFVRYTILGDSNGCRGPYSEAHLEKVAIAEPDKVRLALQDFRRHGNTDQELEAVRIAREAGLSLAEIAQLSGISKTRVGKLARMVEMRRNFDRDFERLDREGMAKWLESSEFFDYGPYRDLRDRVWLRAVDLGFTRKEIAQAAGISASMVGQVVRRAEEQARPEIRHRRTAQEARRLLRSLPPSYRRGALEMLDTDSALTVLFGDLRPGWQQPLLAAALYGQLRWRAR